MLYKILEMTRLFVDRICTGQKCLFWKFTSELPGNHEAKNKSRKVYADFLEPSHKFREWLMPDAMVQRSKMNESSAPNVPDDGRQSLLRYSKEFPLI